VIPGGQHGRPGSRAARALSVMLIAVAALCAAAPARADTMQWWPTLLVASPSSEAWRATLEVQTRLVDDEVDRQDGFNRTTLRLQGGRQVHRRAVLWIGYEKTWPIRERSRHEQRTWQQLEIGHLVGRWTFTQRGRLEQRFLRSADGTVLRARYRLRVSRQLDRGGLWAIAASEEIQFHLNSARLGPDRGFDQHRTSLGVQRRLGSLLVEQGYARQQVSLGPGDTVNHLFQTLVTCRF
jgi:hypothetical protein